MPPPRNFRKRRPNTGPNKNELKSSRNESEKRSRASAGTLRERFPDVRDVQVSYRMESPTGAILEETQRAIGLDEPLLLDVPCQGGCSGGVFLLTEALETVLQNHQDVRDGMGICQTSSYRDPTLPCGTKFYYRLTVAS